MYSVIKYSIIENLRSKFYLASIGMILFIIWLSHYSSQINYNYGNYTLSILTLGMYFTKLILFAFIIFLPVSNLSQEIETGTIYFLLSKKLKRYKYLAAKYITYMILYAALLFFAVFSLWLLTYVFVSKRPEMSLKLLYFMYSEFLSGMMILSIVFFIYTAIKAQVVTSILTAITYFISIMLNSAKEIAEKAQDASVRCFYLFLYYIFPNFSYFNLEKNIVYGRAVDIKYFFMMFCYAAIFSLILFIISAVFFNSREL
ncbi:MAG: ABC transporter permease [Candidatus Aureabacteria bacterium]|nr:ABC transporter permease [Candidatus Auribacterota bacterium]